MRRLSHASFLVTPRQPVPGVVLAHRGPGRAGLTREILHAKGDNTSIFQRLQLPEQRRDPSVFLSYAWSDSERVDKLDQWPRDHGIHVIRDQDSFIAGESIEENIARAISEADKIVAILSQILEIETGHASRGLLRSNWRAASRPRCSYTCGSMTRNCRRTIPPELRSPLVAFI